MSFFMQRNLLILFFIFFLALIVNQICAQPLEYNIIWFGKIGKLYINKTVKDDYAHIEINSEVKIPFVKLNWITSIESLNGKLKNANYSQLLNGKKREFTDITNINDSSWQMITEKGINNKIKVNQPFCTSRLYYEEPVDLEYVFSERFGKSLEIVDRGNGRYRLLLPDDNHCEYFYENGICKEVKAKNGGRTIKMVLVDQPQKQEETL